MSNKSSKAVWHIFTTVALGGFMAACGTPQASFSVLTDLETGRQVQLENGEGMTVVSDLSTSDSIAVPGQLAGTMTDDDYTAMMHKKRTMVTETLPAAPTGEQQLQFQSGTPYALSGSGSFSLATKWDSPKYAKTGSSAVRTTISARTYNPTADFIRIELHRSVPFWFDTSYGTRDYKVDPYAGGSGSEVWSSATSSGDYYVTISKYYNGYWSVGSYSLSD